MTKKITNATIGLLALSMTVVGCTTAVAPTWLSTNRLPEYPSNKYILSTGCGNDIKSAKLNALSSLVDQIHVRVVSKNYYESSRENLTKNTKSRDTIDVSSIETLSGVTYPKTYKNNNLVCVLAALDKNSTKNYIMYDIHNSISNIQINMEFTKNGGIETLKAVNKIKGLVARIQRDQRMAAGLSINIPDQTDYLTSVVAFLNSISHKLTFAIDFSSDTWLGEQTAQEFTNIGLKQVTLLYDPEFVVQGGMKWSEIQPPKDSPYFWVGYSAILSLYDVNSKQSVLELSKTGRTAGETLQQARSLAEAETQKFVKDFVDKIQK